MNKVFPNQLRRSRGALYMAPSEKAALGVALALGLVLARLVHPLCGLGVFVALAAAVVAHRRLDHHRLDHLELLVRSKPTFSLCERDLDYVRMDRD